MIKSERCGGSVSGVSQDTIQAITWRDIGLTNLCAMNRSWANRIRSRILTTHSHHLVPTGLNAGLHCDWYGQY
jgi:hypothetical protein